MPVRTYMSDHNTEYIYIVYKLAKMMLSYTTFNRKDKNIIILSNPNISKITLPQLARRLNNTS